MAAPAHWTYDRTEELKEVRRRLAMRSSFLLHGPAGVGKTFLLSAVMPEFAEVVYCAQSSTPQTIYRSMAAQLAQAGHPALAGAKAKSAVALKGLLRNALRESKYLVVLDHLFQPSQSVAAEVRDLMLHWSVPVVAVSRSAHMEDAGFLLPMFADRSEKFALCNFEAETARRFAGAAAQKQAIAADNLADFLDGIVEKSEGNPGAMLRMLAMAADPKYRTQNRIKVAPLYIDFRIATVSERWNR